LLAANASGFAVWHPGNRAADGWRNATGAAAWAAVIVTLARQGIDVRHIRLVSLYQLGCIGVSFTSVSVTKASSTRISFYL